MSRATPPAETHRLLVAEDDVAVASSLVRGLRGAGFEVELVRDGEAARRVLATGSIQLLVLDLMLDGMSGLDLLEALQGRAHPPVIVLTARTSLDERLRCFALGAVDYVPKPFFLEELVARIRARLRLASESPGRVIRWAGVEVELDARSVLVDGAAVTLTRHEFDILAFLVERPGRAVTREQLAERALSGEDAPEPRTIDTHVARVRRKLGASGAAAVVTVWGIGYRFSTAGLEVG